MKQIENRSRILKLLALVLCFFVEACNGCGFSERCHEEIERKRFLMLSKEQQKTKREECKKWVPVSCYTYSEPTSEELKK
jgi:hypothetical protein